jgi:hypothetical protein
MTQARAGSEASTMQMDSGPASAYAPHDAALLDYFRDHTSATLSCYQDGGRDDVPGSTVCAISAEGLKSIDPRGECRLRVNRVVLTYLQHVRYSPVSDLQFGVANTEPQGDRVQRCLNAQARQSEACRYHR